LELRALSANAWETYYQNKFHDVTPNLKTTSQHTNQGCSSPSLLQLQPGPFHEVSLPAATSKSSDEMASSTSSVMDVTQTARTARTASHDSRVWRKGSAHATPQQQSKYQLSSRCASSPSPCEAALTTPSCPVSLGGKRPNIVLLRSLSKALNAAEHIVLPSKVWERFARWRVSVKKSLPLASCTGWAGNPAVLKSKSAALSSSLSFPEFR